MISEETRAVVDQAKRIYADRLQSTLEAGHQGQFVAIEPESGDYFLGDTFDEAVSAAWAKHSGRLSHTICIGRPAAFHIGNAVQ